MPDIDSQRAKLTGAIAGLEAQRVILGDSVVDSAVATLREQVAGLQHAAEGTAESEERKLVTIVFADVSGFTAMSEKLDAEQVRDLLNACFDCLVPVVQKYGGTIDKFIGDEIMALFGAPIAHEDDAERALRAALEMMETIGAFNQTHGAKLGLHLGINTGLVVAGQLGAQLRSDYSVMGDAVNVAARLEDASAEGEIFVGPATYRLTSRLFDFERVSPMKLKGKEAAIEVYRLLGLKAEPQSTRGIEGLHAPLVGRHRELSLMRAAIEALARGEGSVIAMVGDAGLGKSRLLLEARAASPGGVRWVEGHALSYTGGMSYWLAGQVMLGLLGISAERPPAEIAVALRRSLTECDQQPLFPYLASMLALPLDEADAALVKVVPAEVLQTRILNAVRDYVRACAQRQPHVLVWEDLHWCDPSSRQVFETLLPLTKSVPLLILSAARPEENELSVRPQTDEHVSLTLRLSPLTRAESGSLIRDLLQIENLPEQMRDLILDRAEGNPFFLEELLRSLIESSAVVVSDGRAKAMREIQSVEIPETVQGVLAARIDRLNSEQKQALQRAAVIGRRFQQLVLTYLYAERERAERRIDVALRDLQEREFIQPLPADRDAAGQVQNDFLFKHAITQDVAYSSMLRTRRKELHQLAAQALEALFADRVDELSATIGYHFERADDAIRAVQYLGRAADRAKTTFANQEAVGLYNRAIVALEHTPLNAAQRGCAAQLNESLGDVLTLVAEHEKARCALERALNCLDDVEEIARSRLHRKIGFSHSLQRQFAATAAAFQEADRQLSEEHSERTATWWEEKVQIQMELMQLHYWQGMVAEMRKIADRYRDAIDRHGTATQRAKFLKLLALSLLMESRFRPSAECVKLAEQAVHVSSDSDDLAEATHVRFVLGLIQLSRGNFADAVKHCTIALTSAERVGDLMLQARCITYRATAYRRLGDVGATIEEAERALTLTVKVGAVEYAAMSKAHLAWALWLSGESGRAETLAQEALELWHGMEDPYSFDWMALFPLVAIAVERSDMKRAAAYASGLLAAHQHPLDEEVMAATRTAVSADCATRDATAAWTELLSVASRLHYI